jgi:hypothetical protein
MLPFASFFDHAIQTLGSIYTARPTARLAASAFGRL